MSAVERHRPLPGRALRTVEDWFFAPADPRAYAALRIGYALSAVGVLSSLWPVRHALLAESGLFGAAGTGQPLRIPSVFLWAHTEGAVTAVMIGAGLAMVCLGLGIVPRLSALLVYFWAASYCAAVPVAQSGFDTILRVVGFVLVISPTVPTWSVLGHGQAGNPTAYGLRLVQWQVLLIYACTVWLKAPDPFWRNGEAVTYFLLSMFSRHPSPALAHLGGPLALLTYGTLLIEATVPFLLWMRRTRWVGVALGLSLHVGIAISSKLELFTLAILPLYFAFFETADFDALAAPFRRARRTG